MNSLIVFALLVAPSLGSRLPYIIGGNDIDAIGKYPWQGSIQMNGQHICGCSLVSKNWVLTAGHCIMAETQSVIFGAHDIKTKIEGNPTTYKVDKKMTHPNFDLNGLGVPNDIALMELSTSADISDSHIGVIALAPKGSTNADFTDCVITGWGISVWDWLFPTIPNILQEAKVGLYSRTVCKNKMANVGGAEILDGHVCCGTEGETGACSGDSGGPLVCKYNGAYVQVGLTSWGLSTCDTDYPSVYTRVSEYRDWLSTSTGGEV